MRWIRLILWSLFFIGLACLMAFLAGCDQRDPTPPVQFMDPDFAGDRHGPLA